MKPYAKYKNSGVEWIGEIPEHWEVKKLKYVTNQIIDGTHATPNYIEKGVPFLRVTDIQTQFINLTEVKYISEEEHKQLTKRCKPEKGDVLLSKNGTIGITKVVDWDWDFSVFVSLALIKCNKLIVPNYFSYYFKSNVVEQQISEGSKTTSVTNLHLDKIRELLAILPSITEQTQIAHYLDTKTATIDRLIAYKQKLIALLQEEKAALIQKAVTKGVDTEGVVFKDSGVEWLGEIPVHWEVKKLKYVARVQGRIGFKGYTVSDLVLANEGALTLGAKHISKQNQLKLDDPEYISWEKYYESPEIMVEKGQILIVQRGSLGKIALVSEDIGAATINPSLVILKNIKIVPEYLFHFLQSDAIQKEIELLNTSTAVPMISQNQVENFVLFLPPTLQEQTAIVHHIENQTLKINGTIGQIAREVELLKEYRVSLISAAVTGRIDVRGL